MANIAVAKPEASANQTVPAQQGSVYQLGFNPGDATLTREGDNLKFTFNDGSSTSIENFYTVHGSEDMPGFETDGTQVTGQEFFEAMNEPDLLPAAGPAAGTGTAGAAAGRGGRYNEYGNSDLNGGLDHLTRLDYNSDRGFEWQPEDWITSPDNDAYALYNNMAAGATAPAHPAGPAVTPPDSSPGNPGTPVIPPSPVVPPAAENPPAEPGVTPPANTTPGVVVPPTDGSVDGPGKPSGNVPGQPGTPGNPEGGVPGNPGDPVPGNPGDPGDPNNPSSSSFIHASGSTIVVDEGALPGGTGQHTYHGVAGSGTVILDVHGEGDGRAVFTFTDQDGNTVTFDQMGAIPVSGASVAPTGHVILKVGNVEIDIKSASYDAATGKWTVEYDYRLVESAGHGVPGSETDNIVSYGYGNAITVTVTDFSGDVAQGAITVEIHDDVPVLTVVDPEDPAASTLTGQFVTNFGADGMNEIPFKVDGKEGTKEGDSWVFDVDGGKLVLSPDGGNTWNYEFQPDGDMPAGSRDFVITAIDSDKDETHGTITIRNEKPSITPNVPEKPKDPENPDNPDDPDDPTGEDPKDPDDPTGEDPKDPAVSVDAEGMHIKVDEAALAASKGEQGAGHTHHGFEGSASVTVTLNGGEGGVVEIGNGYTITIVKGEDGSWTATPSGDNTINTGNVSFVFGNAVSADPASGQWTISFDYKLDDNTTHGQPGSATDNVIFDGSIPLKVTDSIGGNTAQSQITVEIHDDVPTLTVTEYENPEDTNLSGTFTTIFGADGMNEIPFKIDGKEGTKDGDSWVFDVDGGKLVLSPDSGNTWNYEFQPDGDMPAGSRDFVITAIDSDKDETHGTITIRNEKPSITPNVPEKPKDPEDPDKPDDPDDPTGEDPKDPAVSVDANGMHIKVDEAALAASKGEQGAGHTKHGFEGSASVTVTLNGGEGGVVEIGNGYTITIVKGEDGSWTATPSGDNTINTGNVSFVFGNAVSANPASGQWTISFDYKLDDYTTHGQPGSATDNVIFDGSIPLKVTDSIGGNTAQSQITVEIHDDVPTLTVTEYENPEDTNLSGTFTTIFGADGMNEIPFKVDGKEGIKDGDSLIFDVDGGKLIVTPNGGNEYSYTFEPDEGTTFTEKNFGITAIDGDKDTATGIITVTNKKPTITPNDPDPHPDPDPENPQNPGVSLTVDGLKVTVDEAAFAERPGAAEVTDNYTGPAFTAGMPGSGDTTHGYAGEASFTVTLNGGEGGTITIGNGYTITIVKGEDGSWTATPSGENVMTVDNVRFDFANAELKEGTDNQWTISFSYAMTGVVNHPDSEKVEGDNWQPANPSITITVKDDTGDEATGTIRVEIHDDGPAIEIAQGDNTSGKWTIGEGEDAETLEYTANLGGTVNMAYGADGAARNDYMTITTEDGIPHTVEFKDGAYKFEDSQGTLTIWPNAANGKLEYSYAPNKANAHETIPNKTFTVTIKDFDGDTASADIKVFQNVKPTFTPGGSTPEGDGQKGSQPETNSVIIKVDEAAWASDKAGSGDKDHGYMGTASFVAQLNGGEDGTITIGEGDKAITFTIKNGGVENFSAQTYEHGVVKLTFDSKPVSDGKGGWTVSFKYELTGRDDHAEGSDTKYLDNIPVVVKDSFSIKVDKEGKPIKDEDGNLITGDGDEATGYIKIEIHDDAPNPTLNKYTVNLTEGKADTQTANADASANAGADELASASYALAIDNVNSGVKASIGGTEYDIKWANGENGSIIGQANSKTVLTVSINSETGKLTVNQAAGISIVHEKDGQNISDVSLTGLKVQYTVADTDGDSKPVTNDVEIKITDAAPVLKDFVNYEVTRGDEYQASRTVDFLDKNKFTTKYTRGQHYEDNASQAGSTSDTSGIDFWGSHIVFTMKDGHVSWISDHYSHFGADNGGNLTGIKDISATIVAERGLGIGSGQNSPGGSQIGIGNDKVTANSTNNPHEDRPGAWHGEGIVIDPRDGGVNYGLNVTLNGFDATDRVVIAFYMTPNKNDDNNSVKLVEFDLSDVNGSTVIHDASRLGGTLTLNIKVPDGFTKAIIAPIPKPDESLGNSKSDFYIEKIEFTAPCFTREGSFGLESAPDAADLKDVSWDWSAVKTALQQHGVDIVDSSGSGHYTISDFDATADKIVVTLSNGNGVNPMNGKTLFTATLHEDGTWKIDQFYKFTVDGKDPADCKVTFTATDADGSPANETHMIDLSLDASVDRFDNVEYGYFDNSDKYKSEPQWDTVADVLTGKGTNDLMYGRGGNDIMFGDKANFKDFAKEVLGDQVDITDPKPYDDNITGLVTPGETGANADQNTKIFDKIKEYVDKGDFDKIEAIVEKAEGTSKGDDALFGGVGNDILFGGKGNDYLNGVGHAMDSKWEQKDHNMLFGGSGNDILVYNANTRFYGTPNDNIKDMGDIIADGGDNVDILLVGSKPGDGNALGGQTNLTLQQMLNDVKDDNGPVVRGIELLFRTNNSDDPASSGITSLDSLAAKGVLVFNDKVYLDSSIWENRVEHTGANATIEYTSKTGEYSVEIVEEYLQPLLDHDIFLGYVKNGVPAESPTSLARMMPLGPDIPEDEDADSVVPVEVGQDDVEMLLFANGDRQASELQAASFAALGIAIADGKVSLDMTAWEVADETPTSTTFKYTGAESKFAGVALEVNDNFLQVEGGEAAATSLLDEMIEMDANGTLHGAFEYSRLAAVHKPLMEVQGEDAIHGGYEGILSEAEDQEIQFGTNSVTAINRSDIYIEGGMGIDIVVTADDLSLGAMLAEGEAEPDPDAEMPAARDVDVLVKGEGLEDVASVEDLAAYGISFTENGAGIELDGAWKLDSIDPDSGVATFVNESTGLTLETTLMQPPAAEEEGTEVAEAGLEQDIVPQSEDDADAQASADDQEGETVADAAVEKSGLEEDSDLLAENSKAENPDSVIEDGLKAGDSSEDTLAASSEEEAETEAQGLETAETAGKPITLVTEAEYRRLEEEKDKTKEAEQRRAEADSDSTNQELALTDIPESPTVETSDPAETASNAMIVNSDSGNVG